MYENLATDFIRYSGSDGIVEGNSANPGVKKTSHVTAILASPFS
jgi:hypothetical protein